MLWDLVSCGHTIVTKQVNERESSFWELTKLTQSTQVSSTQQSQEATAPAQPLSCTCHTVHTHSPKGAHRLGDQ